MNYRKSYNFSSFKQEDGTYKAHFWDGSAEACTLDSNGIHQPGKAYFSDSSVTEPFRNLFEFKLPEEAKNTGEMRFENLTEEDLKKLKNLLSNRCYLFLGDDDTKQESRAINDEFKDYLPVMANKKDYLIKLYVIYDKTCGDSVERNKAHGGTLYKRDEDGELHIENLDNPGNLHPIYTPIKIVRFGVAADGTVYFWEGSYGFHNEAAAKLGKFAIHFALEPISSNALAYRIKNPYKTQKTSALFQDSLFKIKKYFPDITRLEKRPPNY